MNAHEFQEMASDPLPTQEQVDAIAHFIEAVNELKQSPFFVEEFSSLSLSMNEGDSRDQVTAQLPDPSVMRGVIIPFRRVWQQNEPCNFTRVSNILKKYIPFFRVYIDAIAVDKSKDAVNMFPTWKNDKLSCQDLIDVWLNTRYLHVGRSKKEGRFDRADFERLETKIGPAIFEFYFASAVWNLGIHFFNILPFAEKFLSDLHQRGLVPSFSVTNAADGGNVKRSTPGFTPEIESPSHRVWCLRRRRIYMAFNNFLKIADYSDQRVADFIKHCHTFEKFASQSGVHLSSHDKFELPIDQSFPSVSSSIDDHMTAFRNGRCRRGLIGKTRDFSYVLSGEALPIISDQYCSFRESYLSGDKAFDSDAQ